MHDAIIKALNWLAGLAAAQAGIKIDIYEAVLVSNTVMHHILSTSTRLNWVAPLRIELRRAD